MRAFLLVFSTFKPYLFLFPIQFQCYKSLHIHSFNSIFEALFVSIHFMCIYVQAIPQYEFNILVIANIRVKAKAAGDY